MPTSSAGQIEADRPDLLTSNSPLPREAAMLAQRLVRAIEDHAEELTRGVLEELSTSPRTPSYHRLSREELHRRVYEVYRNLGRWLDVETEEEVAVSYGALGHRRRSEGIPLEEVIYALILTKHHLRDYILRAGVVESALDLYLEEDLHLRLVSSFDKALYHTVRGYQGAAAGAVSVSATDR
jgi:hypothetical protein